MSDEHRSAAYLDLAQFEADREEYGAKRERRRMNHMDTLYAKGHRGGKAEQFKARRGRVAHYSLLSRARMRTHASVTVLNVCACVRVCVCECVRVCEARARLDCVEHGVDRRPLAAVRAQKERTAAAASEELRLALRDEANLTREHTRRGDGGAGSGGMPSARNASEEDVDVRSGSVHLCSGGCGCVYDHVFVRARAYACDEGVRMRR
eukprot:4335889-Pleurochrysis_carterae.AAC.2